MTRKYCDREFDLLQKIKEENKRLKRELAALRKQISRLDIDRYENLKELVQKQYEEDKKIEKTDNLDNHRWLCWNCKKDVLKLTILHRRDGEFYYRFCQNCKKRTKLQKYDKKNTKE
jgi:hypothetical protein